VLHGHHYAISNQDHVTKLALKPVKQVRLVKAIPQQDSSDTRVGKTIKGIGSTKNRYSINGSCPTFVSSEITAVTR
jgi:hypothetical protein